MNLKLTMQVKHTSIISGLFNAYIDIYTDVVCIRFGNCCWSQLAVNPTPPADILADALTWLSRLHCSKVAVKTQ